MSKDGQVNSHLVSLCKLGPFEEARQCFADLSAVSYQSQDEIKHDCKGLHAYSCPHTTLHKEKTHKGEILKPISLSLFDTTCGIN